MSYIYIYIYFKRIFRSVLKIKKKKKVWSVKKKKTDQFL